MLLKDWLYKNSSLLLENKIVFDWAFGTNKYFLRVLSKDRVEYKRQGGQKPAWSPTNISDLRKFEIQYVSVGKRKIVGDPTISLVTSESLS